MSRLDRFAARLAAVVTRRPRTIIAATALVTALWAGMAATGRTTRWAGMATTGTASSGASQPVFHTLRGGGNHTLADSNDRSLAEGGKVLLHEGGGYGVERRRKELSWRTHATPSRLERPAEASTLLLGIADPSSPPSPGRQILQPPP